ncbi:MAG: hypothetical protein QOK41_1607, partial [Sphingomonadales bacterium]|nr:hypothetical protein [Sphingomonadales bacterium]
AAGRVADTVDKRPLTILRRLQEAAIWKSYRYSRECDRRRFRFVQRFGPQSPINAKPCETLRAGE